MSVRTDVINLNVNINGNKAQNDLNNLRKRAADVKLEMEGLKKGTDAYIAKKKELAGINQQMIELKKTIGITALSQKELTAELNKLKALRGSVVPFTKEYKDLSEQIGKVEKRLYDVRNGVQGFASFFSKIKDEVKQFGAVAAGYLGFQFITSQFQNIIRSGAKLSDQLADIRRVTGLTAEEVLELNKQLGGLNTRTSTEGLRQIAIIAGKLGIAKEEVFEFTAAVDQLVVALGDELGDADQITTQLGKIINVFDKTGKVTGDNILRAGNALVSLANSGVASGGFIVDFTQRLAGLAKTANLSVEASFGLGAALEELGQRSESSSTAIIKVLGSIGKDVPKFAKIAGMSVEAFTEILRKSPEEALIRLSEALVKGKVGFDEISKAFDAAGEDGARVVTTLGVIGGKAEFVRDKIRQAGTALQETSEITEAFNLKNETFGATLDKLGKEFNKLITSTGVTKFFQSVAEAAFRFIRAIREIPTFLRENRVALLTLVAGLLILNRTMIISAVVTIRDTAAKWLNVIATRAGAIAASISGAAQTAYAIIVAALTGKITLATAAQRLWNIAMSIGLGPVGVLITAIGVLAVAMGALGGKTKVLAAEQRNFSEINAKVTDDIGNQVTNMKRLTEIAKDNNLSLDTRKKALNELIKINPQYLSGLTLENIALKEGITILDTYSFMLKKVAQDKARLSVQDDLLKERTRLETERPQLEIDANNSSVLNPFNRSDKKFKENLQRTIQINNQLGLIDAQIKGSVQGISDLLRLEESRLKSLQKGTAEYNNQLLKIDLLKKRQTVLLGADPNTLAATGGGGGGGATGTGAGDDKAKHIKDELEQFKKEVEKLRRDMELNGKTADEQEVLRIEQKYAELLERAKKFNYAVLELEGFKQKELDAIYKKQFEKRFNENNTAEYEQSLQNNADYFNQLRRQQAVFYNSGQIDKQQYDEAIAKLDRDELKDRLTIAADYSATVKKAGDDLVTLKKKQEEQVTKDLIDEVEKRKKTQEEQSSDNVHSKKRKTLTTRKGSPENIEAQKELAQAQFDLDTLFLNKKSELYLLKEQELQDQLAAIDEEAWKQKLLRAEKFADMFSQAMSSLFQIIKGIEDRNLQRDKKQNQQKVDNLKKQLEGKLINQNIYDKKVQELNLQLETKEKEAKRRQAKREKALNIFQAIVNTASAVAEALPNLPLSILAGVLGGLSVAAIIAQPLPELGKGNWIRNGDKHSAPSGGIHAKIERDEAVMSAAAMTDKDTVTVTGNTAQITSALNSRRGGRGWAAGAKVVQMPAWVTQRPAAINSNVPGILKQGAFNNSAGQMHNNSLDFETLIEINKAMLSELVENRNEIRTMKTRMHAVVSIKEYREMETKYDTAKKVAGIKQ